METPGNLKNLTSFNSLNHFKSRYEAGLPITSPIRVVLDHTQMVIDEKIMFPSRETYSLAMFVGHIINASMRRPLHVLDVGTGSGVNMIALAKTITDTNSTQFIASDIDPRALQYAEANFAINGIQEVDLRQRDTLEGMSQEYGKIDVIFTSPPWYPGEIYYPEAFKPQLAVDGGQDGLSFYRELIIQSKEVLSHLGMIAFRTTRWQWNDVYDLTKAHFPMLDKYAIYLAPKRQKRPSGLIIANSAGFAFNKGFNSYIESNDFHNMGIPPLRIKYIDK